MQIRFVHVNGLFFVNLVGTSQHIVCQTRFFCRVTNVSEREVIGAGFDVTPEMASELGFINVAMGQHTEEAIAI